MIPRIDFLPDSYHQRRQRHQKKVWRRALLAVFLALIVLGSLRLKQTHSELRATRDALQATARSMHSKLEDAGRLKQHISRLDAEANVVTLLRVNAAPTRVIAAVTQSLPQHVTLNEFRLYREKLDAGSRSPTESAADAASAFPAELDLARLRNTAAETALHVSLKGIAPDDIAISKFLASLHASGLFSDAQLIYTDLERFGDFPLRSFAIRLRLRKPGTAPTPAGSQQLETPAENVAQAQAESPVAPELSADRSSSTLNRGTAIR